MGVRRGTGTKVTVKGDHSDGSETSLATQSGTGAVEVKLTDNSRQTLVNRDTVADTLCACCFVIIAQ